MSVLTASMPRLYPKATSSLPSLRLPPKPIDPNYHRGNRPGQAPAGGREDTGHPAKTGRVV